MSDLPMSDLQLLDGHEKDLGGGFRVRRVLPAARRRSVGPFVFFDHFGPAVSHGDREGDVRPHPHIGLATVTYLFEGAMLHHDSTGARQRIAPGAINWMTAGRGIVHSERTPEDLRGVAHTMHGLQLWAALPREHEEAEPAFSHTPAEAIPERIQGGVHARVLIGEAFGERSPVPTLMPTLYLDLRLAPGASLRIDTLADEVAVYAPTDALWIDGAPLAPRRMAVPAGAATLACPAQAQAPARVMLIGGRAVDGPRFLWWNFVSSRRERVLQAADDWERGRFAKVAGESDFIPLPAQRPG